MSISQIITMVMLAFLILGAADHIIGDRFGLGQEFMNGLLSMGRLLLVMGGFITLAPVIARIIGPITTPFFTFFGADPSLLAGILLANDSGAAPLAMKLAVDAQAGLFSGLIVGSMLGTTVMFTITITLTSTKGDERPAVIYGLLSGIITIPVGCIIGGIAANFPTSMVLKNTAPILLVSLLLLFLLLRFGSKLVPVFIWIGNGILALSVFGLAVASIQQLTDITLISGMDSLEEVFIIVGNIAIFLSGAFTFLAVIRHFFARSLSAIGRRFCINEISVSGLLMTTANGLPACDKLKDMDPKGRMFNAAYMVSASCLLGDHLAYTAQVAPELVGPVLIGKAVAGVLALVVVQILAPHFLPETTVIDKNVENNL